MLFKKDNFDLKSLSEKTDDELTEVIKNVHLVRKQRFLDVRDAFLNSDLKKISEILSKKINLSEELFDTLIRSEFSFFDFKIYDTIKKFNGSYDDISLTGAIKPLFLARDFFQGNLQAGKKINPIELLLTVIKYKVFRELNFGVLTDNFFDATIELFGKDFLKNNVPLLKKMMAEIDLKKDCFKLQQYLKDNDLTFVILDGIKSKENINFFTEENDYSKIFQELTPDELSIFMNKAITEANEEKIKFLHSFGVPFPTTKQCYSDLFLKTKQEHLPAQKFVVENIPNIECGDQVILKTILHKNYNDTDERLHILKVVLIRYNSLPLELLEKALHKRESSILVDATKKYYDSRVLMNEFDGVLENKTTTPKMKI